MKEKPAEESCRLEISIIEVGILKLIFIGAELFSGIEDILEERMESPFMLITCANGMEGYFPSATDYEKGGYEVETAIFFYNSFLPKIGSLESIANETIEMINQA